MGGRANMIMAIAIGAAVWSHPASARIACKNGYQNVSGSWLSTPYCQDALVSIVAKEYGVNAPAAEVRENPNFKRNVCRLIGSDIRIRETCNEVSPNGRARF